MVIIFSYALFVASVLLFGWPPGLFSFFSSIYIFIGLQACFAGWLVPKETKKQGWDLMSDKLVEILTAVAQGRFLPVNLNSC